MGKSQSQLSSGTKSDNKIVIVKASWCGACKHLKSMLTDLNAQGVNVSNVMEIDEKDMPTLSPEWSRIVSQAYRKAGSESGFPLLIKLKGNQIKKVQLGAPPQPDQLLAFLRM